jgi:hypothetical protein
MRVAICIVLLFLLDVAWPCSGQQLEWKKLASGIWLAKAGNPDSVNFLTTGGAEPKISTINAMADVPFPLSEGEISYKLVDGKTYLHFPLDNAEKYLGLA